VFKAHVFIAAALIQMNVLSSSFYTYWLKEDNLLSWLMDTASEIPRYQWRKDASRILIGRKNDVLVNSISSRSDFTPSNGTFRISNLSRTDSGEYTLEIFNSNGEKTISLCSYVVCKQECSFSQ
uniref:Uncharacterized protein n=1 Tax=Stegastes partitus TaxID=144197 RepID=A0A3B5ADM1_9TELE